MRLCGSTPFRLDVEAPRHRRFPDGGRLTLTARFLAISARVGAFSRSRSDLELDESVEDPEAADACFPTLWTVWSLRHFTRARQRIPTDRTSVYYCERSELSGLFNHGL